MKIIAIQNNHACGNEFWGLIELPDEANLPELLEEYKRCGTAMSVFGFFATRGGKRLEFESVNVNDLQRDKTVVTNQ